MLLVMLPKGQKGPEQGPSRPERIQEGQPVVSPPPLYQPPSPPPPQARGAEMTASLVGIIIANGA